ncbi:MAG: hypothetical protein H6745_02535 [Deltaproteobacteria bacterium]|nr:hypothetical protein [Deltaproteobacteria bacterium]
MRRTRPPAPFPSGSDEEPCCTATWVCSADTTVTSPELAGAAARSATVGAAWRAATSADAAASAWLTGSSSDAIGVAGMVTRRCASTRTSVATGGSVAAGSV